MHAPPQCPGPRFDHDPPRRLAHRRGSPASGAVGRPVCRACAAPFEAEEPRDPRPRSAIDAARAWGAWRDDDDGCPNPGRTRDGCSTSIAGAARFAAYAAGQAACVGHVAEHELGAAAYAIATSSTNRFGTWSLRTSSPQRHLMGRSSRIDGTARLLRCRLCKR